MNDTLTQFGIIDIHVGEGRTPKGAPLPYIEAWFGAAALPGRIATAVQRVLDHIEVATPCQEGWRPRTVRCGHYVQVRLELRDGTREEADRAKAVLDAVVTILR